MGKKIGLVLAHKGTNYGALLQAYATQQLIDSWGFSTEIINYKADKYRRSLKFDWGLFPYIFNGVKNRFLKQKKAEVLSPEHLKNKEERRKRGDEFRLNRLHDIRTYNGYVNLQQAGMACDAVLIGSDQQWVPGTSFGNHISLRFVPDNVRKISYATSLGVSQYPNYCKNSAKDMWRRIDFLSVREEQGKKIIEDIDSNIDVKVVADPTYLLTKNEWEQRIPFERKAKEKYVFCYFLGNSEHQKDLAAKFAREKGLKLYSILSDESVSKNDLTYTDNVITGASPEDFINWIRGAEYVITDSFHGLAFSVINEKQFFIFYRKRTDAKQSRNSRIDNILNMWDVKNRFVPTESENIPDIKDIDYSKVNELVAKKRADSLAFLKQALTF